MERIPWEGIVIAVCLFTIIQRTSAQQFSVLHSFAALSGSTNSDGGRPFGGLFVASNVLFGTSFSGGVAGAGTVFKIGADGTGFATLHNFTGGNGGANPESPPLVVGSVLFGTTYQGGSSLGGTIYRIDMDGTGYAKLHDFAASSGPAASVIISGDMLYGTTERGGTFGKGTVYKINTNGADFLTLHNFPSLDNSTNSDGANPNGKLCLADGMLYGTTENGGAFGRGTVFGIRLDGTGFTNLHSFNGTDGASPYSGMILVQNTLYGTTSGINFSPGSVFRINTDGSGFTNLHSFAGSDGSSPQNDLVLIGTRIYGTTMLGGSFGRGTLFTLTTDGGDFVNLYSFSAPSNSTNSDGIYPNGVVIASDTLFGTAYQGGTSGRGTIFSFALPPPPLKMNRSGEYVFLTWETNMAGVFLESTTSLVPPLVWDTNSPTPTVVEGQNSVTYPRSDPQRFFRLRR